MKEVSGKIVALYLSAVRPEEASRLLEGLAFQGTSIPERISWEEFCILSTRIERLLGGTDGLIALGASILKHSDFSIYQSAFQLVASPRLIYWASNRWGGPSVFTHITNKLESIGPDQIRVTLTIPEGYAGCSQIFAVNQGLFAAVPRLLGLPDAVVELSGDSRVGVYTISMPPSLTLWARLRRASGVLFSARLMFEELGRQQESLRARYAELEQAHARIAQEHRHALEARDIAEEALRVKSSFLATISHELRTPLNGVLGAAALLQDTALSAEQQDLLTAVQRSGEGLQEMVNNILDFSLLDADAAARDVQRSPAVPREVLAQLARSCASAALKKGLRFHSVLASGVPEQVLLDVPKVTRVLGLLLDNALKFTEHGELRLGCQCDGETLRFEVCDTGIGISAADLERVFQPFVQVDGSLTRRYGGSGMGLATAERLAHLLGGTLKAESTPGGGSRFWLTLPLELPLPTALSRPDEAAPSGPLRVLVVEDNLINQQILAGFLRKLDVRVEVASDGQQAVARLQAAPDSADVILMDCHMPVMDGFEASTTIRGLPRPAAALPIIAVTADVTPGVQERCRQAGMDDYIDKPVTREKLLGVLERWQPHRKIA